MTAFIGIVLPCILSIILWGIYLFGTNEMTIIRWILVLVAAFCPVINVTSLIMVISFMCCSKFDVDYTTKCGKIIRFFTKKR